MRFRGLLVAVVVLAALGVGLYFSNKEKAAEAAKPPTDAPPKILALSEADVTKVDVKKKGGDETVVERAGGKWKMTAPKAYPADQDATNQLVTAASNISGDRVVEDKASNLAAYGLNSPNIEVDITSKGGKVSKLKIGDDTPTNSGSYAMLEGDPRVFTVASYVKTGVDKSANDLRDKRLLSFDQDKLSRVELIAKKQNIEFGRDKDHWQIVKPKPLRADSLQVDEMLRKLKDAKMDLTLTDDEAKKAVAAFASGMPVATVKLTDSAGTQQIDVRKNKDDYYAKSSVVAGVFKATPELGMGVDKSLDDFRNKKLFDFGFSDPSKIDMHANGKTFAFQKNGDDWFSSGKKMDSVSVQSFLDKLRDLSASKFVDTGALGTPAIDITVVSNGGKLTEKVLIAKQGADYVAQRENEPALYGLDAKTVNDLSQAASDVKPAPPAKK
ncbi:MAG TPA: DUF4340 domain-containing protein [Bryobacteraceae bacterium]|jgi:hypothetical protein|nr:DUF4340 domain-containing protein [Bryobacteraceae bacterium]